MPNDVDFEDLLGGSSLEVELDAYVLPNSHTVWKATAGKTHRFYRAVRDANTIFPDIRDLETLGDDPSKWKQEDLLKAIADDRWQRELVSRARGNQEQSSEGINKNDRGILTFANRLWLEAKKGDLILVPAEGWREPVLIGEILSDAGDITKIEAQDGDYTGTFFGRRVSWRAAVHKADLSDELIAVVHTRAAVFPIAESLKEEVYRLAYGNFVYKGNFVAEFRTSKERFTAEDSAVVGTWLNALDVLRNALESGDSREGETFAELGLDKLPDELAAELKINIQSPGEIFVRTTGPFALALMTLFALGGCSAQAVDKNAVTVRLKHVGGGDPAVQQQVEKSVSAIKTALGEKRIEKSNLLVARAQKDAMVSTRATLKHVP